MTRPVRIKWILLPSLLLLTAGLAAARDDVSKPPASPLSPAEARALFQIEPGLKIELVAAEPEISAPVEIAFDERGRMWVVEMGDYPNGPAPGEKPAGRIKVLEDLDHDGRYERVTLFADGLLFANGILPWKGGVIVTAAPEVLYLKDTDGDGDADVREVLYRGFIAGNPQLRVSHPTLGLDGWVYAANGLRGGSVVRVGEEGAKPIEIGGLDFRFDLIHDRAEAISGMGQYGLTFDAWGNRFVCDNRHHLRHIVFPNRYAKRNPFLAIPDVVQDISILGDGPLSSGGKIFPLSRNWTTSSLHAGHFTAACGVHILGGDLFPSVYQGAAFTCDPTGNLVHMERLTPVGASFQSRPTREGVEFLATPDTWFRPVNLADGPDGALYLVDMYRAVIEHPEFMPAELKARSDLNTGKERGRIWRIAPSRTDAGIDHPPIDRQDRERLVRALGHPNAWRRLTAQRLLLEDLKPADHLALKARLRERRQDNPLAAIQAAWLLDGAGGLDRESLVGLLESNRPARLLEHAVRIAESRIAEHADVRDRVIALANHPDGKVRFQVALSLGAWDDDGVIAPLGRIARASSEDRWTRLAVESAVPTRAGLLLRALARPDGNQPSPGRQEILRELAELVGARHDDGEVRAALADILDLPPEAPDSWKLVGIGGLARGLARGRAGRGLGELVAGLEASGVDPDRKLADGAQRFFQSIGAAAARVEGPADERIEAIQLMAFLPWSAAQGGLRELLIDPSQDVRVAAVRSLAAHRDPEVVAALLAPWKSATPHVRREIVAAMLRQPDRVAKLLDQIEAGAVKPGDLDAVHVRTLSNLGREDLRDRARKLLQNALPKERTEVLARYQPALASTGDAARGRDIFKKNCSTCHRIAGIGVDVGPDIGDTRTKTKEALLGDILVPNQAIDANYVSYVVATKDGAVVDGVIAAETASSLTLRRAEGKTDVILRGEIEELKSTGQSLMPDGLEKNIDVGEMADLLTFLKDWRYLEGDVPKGTTGR